MIGHEELTRLKNRIHELERKLDICDPEKTYCQEKLLNFIKEPVAILDKDYSLQFANQAFNDTFQPDYDPINQSLELVTGKKVFHDVLKECIDQSAIGGKSDCICQIKIKEQKKVLKFNFCPGKDIDGMIENTMMTIQDITEMVTLKNRIEKVNRNWERAVNSIDDSLLMINKDYEIEDINENGLKLIGKGKEKIIGKKCYEALHDDDQPCEHCPVHSKDNLKKTGALVRYDSKSEKWFSIKTSPVFNENEEIERYVDVIRDISRIKKSELRIKKQNEENAALNEEYLAMNEELMEKNEEYATLNEEYKSIIEELDKAKRQLQQSEEIHRLTLSNISDAVFITDEEFNFRFICPNVQTIFGYTMDEVEQKINLHSLLPGLNISFKEIEARNELRNYEMDVINKENRVIHALVNLKKVNILGGTILVTVRDITDRKKAEEKARMVQKIINRSPAIAFQWENKQGWPVSYVSHNVVNITGYSAKEFLNRDVSYIDIIHKDDIERVSQEVKIHSEDNNCNSFAHEPYRIITKSGDIIWVEDLTFMNRKGEQIVAFEGIITDCTERILAEKRLQESEVIYRNTFEYTSVGIAHVAIDGSFIRINRKFAEIIGYTIEELKKITWEEITYPDDISLDKKHIEKVFKNEVDDFSIQKRYIHKNGSIVWIHLHSAVVRDDSGNIKYAIAVINDITKIKELQIELAKTNEQLELALKSANMGIWDWDVNTGKVNWYGEHASLFGIKDEDFGGTIDDLQKIIHIDDREKGKNMLRKVIEEGKEFINEYRVVWPDKSVHWMYSYGNLVRDNNGNPWRIIGTTQNITDRKTAEEKLKFQSELLNNINDFVTATDLDGNINYVNEKVKSAFNKTEDDIIKEHVEMFGEDEDLGATQEEIMKETRRNGVWRGEVINLDNEGNRIFLDCRTKLLKDNKGKPYGMVGISTDITTRKKYEKDLKRINEELAAQNEEYLALNEELKESLERIQIINLELEVARRKAEESDRLKSAFLANMSHEIRTPLNGILGFTSLMTKKTSVSQIQKERYASIIKRSSDGLLQIINDILDVSRIETGELEIFWHELNVNEMLNEIFLIFNKKITENQSKIELRLTLAETEMNILIDDVRLRQVFTNLLDNAIKFTDRGKVEFGVQEITEQFIYFYVSDTGIGIPKNKQKIIFDRFRQGDISSDRVYGGNGLGLSIVKSLIELMGGKITVDSVPGKGTTFTFSIPNNTKEHEEPGCGDQDKETIQPDNLKILIVEDDMVSNCFLEEIFKDTSHHIDIVTTGKEGLEKATTEGYDVILMDIRLPDKNGLDIVREIRKKDKDTHIIAQTAFAMESDQEKALEAGCNDYVSKPINTSLLFEKLGKIRINN